MIPAPIESCPSTASLPVIRLARTHDSRLMLMRLPSEEKYEIRFCPFVNKEDKSLLTFDTYDSYEKAKDIFYKMVHIFGYWERTYPNVAPVIFLHEPYGSLN